MKNIKRILLLLMPLLMMLGACNQTPPPGGSTGKEREVEMRFSAPTTYSPTRAADPEDALQTMQILVFDGPGDNAKFLYRRNAWKKTGSDNMFRSTLLIDKDVTLRFAANANDVLASANSVLVEGTPWSTIRDELVMTRSELITVAGGLPMWGEAVGVEIKDQKSNTLDVVYMLRSVASTEITLLPDTNEFELEEVWLVYAADKGYLPFDPSLITGTGTGIEASGPYSPSDFGNAADIQLPVKRGDKIVENVYMFDNAAALYTIGNVKPTRVILKGIWKKGQAGAHSTYFPLTFRDPVKEEKLQVTRNTKYVIQISKVNGDGYETLDDAKRAEDINVEYEVIPWNNNDDELIISENMWVSLQTKGVTLPRTTNYTVRLGFSTNYLTSDMYMWDGTQYVKGQVVVKDEAGNDFCSVSIISTMVDNRYEFLFRLLRNYDASTSHEGTLKVKIGRITFDIGLRQYDVANEDWGSGGEVPWG